MNTQQIIIREQWRALNVEINQHERTLDMNTKAGHVPTREYLDWLQAKRDLRDELQTKF
jgi:hypothetical protein